MIIKFNEHLSHDIITFFGMDQLSTWPIIVEHIQFSFYQYLCFIVSK